MLEAHWKLAIDDLMHNAGGHMWRGANGGLAVSRERAMCGFLLTRGTSPALEWLPAIDFREQHYCVRHP
jgi:hypothetical protein